MKRYVTLISGLLVAVAAHCAGEPWRFVSMPDFLNVDTDYPQKGWEDSLSFILQSVKAEQPDFLVVPGDLVMGHWHKNDVEQGLPGIERFARQYYSAWKARMDAAGLKWYAGIGDHEIGDNPWKYPEAPAYVQAYKAAFRQHLNMPLNGPEHMKGTAYWWRHKNVLFVAVDVFEEGTSRQGSIRAGVTGPQLAWLKQVLAENRDAAHIIVMGHSPCSGPVRTWSSSNLMIEEGRESPFWKTMAEYGVDLYLCGEVHAITCTERDGIQQVAHGGLIGYNERTNYLLVEVFDDHLEFTLKEIDLVASGKKLWQPGENRPLEQVDITPEMRARGFIPVGKETLDKTGSGKVFKNQQGCFLKKFEASAETGSPVFVKNHRPLPRINLDGSTSN